MLFLSFSFIFFRFLSFFIFFSSFFIFFHFLSFSFIFFQFRSVSFSFVQFRSVSFSFVQFRSFSFIFFSFSVIFFHFLCFSLFRFFVSLFLCRRRQFYDRTVRTRSSVCTMTLNGTSGSPSETKLRDLQLVFTVSAVDTRICSSLIKQPLAGTGIPRALMVAWFIGFLVESFLDEQSDFLKGSSVSIGIDSQRLHPWSVRASIRKSLVEHPRTSVEGSGLDFFLNFFRASIAARFLVTFLEKNHVFEPCREVPLWDLFSFFSSLFLFFFFFFFLFFLTKIFP